MIIKNQSLIKYIFLYVYNPNTLNPKEKQQLFAKYALVHNVSVIEAEEILERLIIN